MKWINIKDSLPPKKANYLVLWHSDRISIGKFVEACGDKKTRWEITENSPLFGLNTFRTLCKIKNPKITHWMPLPEIPKGDK